MSSLLDRHDLLLADLDGTLYRGREAVPGAVEAVRRAGERGIRTVYVTNNASRSPADVAAHLAELGFPAGADDVATSSQAAAALLSDQLPGGAKVLVVGTDALRAEVTAVGLTPVDAADGAAAVVQGLDPQLRYATLAEACIALRAGAVWVACNVDPTLPSERGPVPGNGSLVAVLRTANRLEPQVAGKPAPALMRKAVERVGGRTPLVVGDVLYTDIQGGRERGHGDPARPHGRRYPRGPARRATGGAAGLRRSRSRRARPRPGRPRARSAARLDGRGDGTGGLTLSGDGDPLDALRALCGAHWASGGGPAQVAAERGRGRHGAALPRPRERLTARVPIRSRQARR